MSKQKRTYQKLKCWQVWAEPANMILADSINFSGKISSVGQEVGVDETFIEGSYVNSQWETDF